MQQTKKCFLVFLIGLTSSCEDVNQIEANLPKLAPEQVQQQLIEQENQKLEQIKALLSSLKNQYQTQSQLIDISYPLQISSNRTQIQNLTDILNSLQLSEKDIDSATNAVFREQNLVLQNRREQIEPAINNLQQSITQTQEQIYVWTNSGFSLTEPQRTLLKSLEDLLASQRQQLESLNKQKSDLSENALSQTRLINQLAQQQKSQIIESQTSTQEQIFFLRDEIERLNESQIQQRSVLTTLNQHINQTQKDYDNQFKKIKELQQTIKQ